MVHRVSSRFVPSRGRRGATCGVAGRAWPAARRDGRLSGPTAGPFVVRSREIPARGVLAGADPVKVLP